MTRLVAVGIVILAVLVHAGFGALYWFTLESGDFVGLGVVSLLVAGGVALAGYQCLTGPTIRSGLAILISAASLGLMLIYGV
jgi:hypothetical protein